MPRAWWEDPLVLSSVLIVDDHRGFRRLARQMLERDGWSVVGEAHDGASALRFARLLRPDVVLLDVVLPDLDGFVVSERIAELDRPPLVVLTSSRELEDLQERLQRMPVCGFLAKRDLTG